MVPRQARIVGFGMCSFGCRLLPQAVCGGCVVSLAVIPSFELLHCFTSDLKIYICTLIVPQECHDPSLEFYMYASIHAINSICMPQSMWPLTTQQSIMAEKHWPVLSNRISEHA